LELQELVNSERLAEASLLVLANKQDLQGAVPLAELQTTLQLSALNRNVHIVGTNAKSGEGLEPAIRWLVNDIASRIYIS
jgi:ADP-ribosylation factor-like protein 2